MSALAIITSCEGSYYFENIHCVNITLVTQSDNTERRIM